MQLLFWKGCDLLLFCGARRYGETSNLREVLREPSMGVYHAVPARLGLPVQLRSCDKVSSLPSQCSLLLSLWEHVSRRPFRVVLLVCSWAAQKI